jgi:hypothetical protein
MIPRILILASLMPLGLIGCAAEQPVDLNIARQNLIDAWQADRHIVWEIDWPAAPVGGALTVETWRAGDRYRFEVLESTAPALVGQTLIFDGQTAWRYDRFEPEPPMMPSSPVLSPVSDAFATVDRLITTPPTAATRQESSTLNHGPAQKIRLIFENGDSLAMWLDPENGLPVRIHFSVGSSQANLQARSFEPLSSVPKELFTPAEWLTEP